MSHACLEGALPAPAGARRAWHGRRGTGRHGAEWVEGEATLIRGDEAARPLGQGEKLLTGDGIRVTQGYGRPSPCPVVADSDAAGTAA